MESNEERACGGYSWLPPEVRDFLRDYLSHLEELRVRLIKAVLGLSVGTAISFFMVSDILRLLTAPIGGLSSLQAIEVTENISVYMRVLLFGGFILAFPVLIYQVVAFFFPGLNYTERGWLLLSIPAATGLFLAGVVFTYLVLLPTAIPFLVNFLGIRTVPRVSSYIEFVTELLFWVGVSFEAPLVVFVLAKLKLVSAKQLIQQWRIAVVVIAIAAAVITPTGDPITMGLMMLPLLGLYGLSVLLAAVARRQ